MKPCIERSRVMKNGQPVIESFHQFELFDGRAFHGQCRMCSICGFTQRLESDGWVSLKSDADEAT